MRSPGGQERRRWSQPAAPAATGQEAKIEVLKRDRACGSVLLIPPRGSRVTSEGHAVMVAHPRTSPPPPPCARLRSEHHSGFILSLSGCHVGLWAAGKNKSYQHHATSPSGKELAGNLFGCPPRGSEWDSKQSQGFHSRAPVGRYGWRLPIRGDFPPPDKFCNRTETGCDAGEDQR